MAKKLKENPLGFFNINSVAKLQKIEGEKIPKKSHSAKNTGMGTFWPRPVLYVTRFSSLGQMVQFDTIKFRRTL